MDVLVTRREKASVEALWKGHLVMESDCSETDIRDVGFNDGFSEKVPIKVLVLMQATHRLFETVVDGSAKRPSKRGPIIRQCNAPVGTSGEVAEGLAKARGAKGETSPSISRNQMLSMRGSTSGQMHPPAAPQLPQTRSVFAQAPGSPPKVVQSYGGVAGPRVIEGSQLAGCQRRHSSDSTNDKGPRRRVVIEGLQPLPQAAARPEADRAEACPEDDAEALADDESNVSEGGTDDEIIVGPTPMAAQPLTFAELFIPDSNGSGGKSSILSGIASIRMSEVTRLKCTRGGSLTSLPLSFGSVLHICGHEDRCRPCMFERSAGRCRKSWLCDFCHMHTGRKRKVIAVPWQDQSRSS